MDMYEQLPMNFREHMEEINVFGAMNEKGEACQKPDSLDLHSPTNLASRATNPT